MLPHNSAESPRIRPGLPPLFVAQRLGRQQARRLACRVEAEGGADLSGKPAASSMVRAVVSVHRVTNSSTAKKAIGQRCRAPTDDRRRDGPRSADRPAILQLLHALAQRLQFGTQLLDFGTPLR